MYNHVVIGGTFDHFHSGHKDLLTMAFAKSRHVTLGLTKASMNTHKEAHEFIQSFALRKNEIMTFVRALDREKDLTVLPIHDMYGETLTDTSLEAIIVTPHTRTSAELINEKRKTVQLDELTIETCPLRRDHTGQIISSSRIRLGEIDREGTISAEIFTEDLYLNDRARELLRRPFGIACGARKLKKKNSPIVVVGDKSTQYCCEHSVPFCSAFIDGKTKKQNYSVVYSDSYSFEHTNIRNDAGRITSNASKFMYANALKQIRSIYLIEGEEDLLTVASVLLLPFGTRVVYGYPYHPESMRCITVSERSKKRFLAILQS